MVTKSSKKGKNKSMVVSSCGLKLDGMKFDAVGSTRKEELKHKLTVFPMANIPVVCPLSSCSAVVWKYNLMAHMASATRPRKANGARGGGKGVVQQAGEESGAGGGGEVKGEEEQEAEEGMDSTSISSLLGSDEDSEGNGGKEVVVEVGDSSSSIDSNDSGEGIRPCKAAHRKR
ncbi:hypothetical protein VYU27_000530 [Nannochloropsis oceanica]